VVAHGGQDSRARQIPESQRVASDCVSSLENTIERATPPVPPPRHLALGTLLATGAQIAPIVASAGLSLAVARLYGPSGTGVIALVANLFNIVAMVFGVGLASGITYLVSRHAWPLRRAAHDMDLAAVGLGLVGAVCGIAFYFLTRNTVLKNVTAPLAIVTLSSLPLALSWSFSTAAALGRERYEAYATLQAAHALVLLVAGVALAAAFGLIGAMVGYAFANLITAILGAVWIRREAARASLDRDDDTPGDQLRRASSFGLKTWPANLLQLLNYRLDLFILSAVATRSAVGVYAIAVSVTSLGWLLPNALQAVLFPRVASLDAAAGERKIATETSDAAAARAVRHSVVIIFPTAVALAGLVLIVPLLYGHGFDHSVMLGFILIPGVSALGVAKVLSAVFTGRGFPQFSVYTTAITVPITLLLYLVLIPSFDATGAAIASTLSYSASFAISVVYFGKATTIPLRQALIPSRSDLVDYVDAFRIARARLSRAR
jgi:O-antigen/teichoic acid export membrane protein